MKPFAHWAIHKQQKIRIAGRSDTEVWGNLVGPDGQSSSFRYAPDSRRLTIGEGPSQRVLVLDDYGFERTPPKL